MAPGHTPVLLEETLGLLDPPAGGVVVDATAGGGGHAAALAARLGPAGLLVAVDRDREAVRRVAARLAGAGTRVWCVHEDFRHLDRVLSRAGLGEVDAILADLGLSSFQLEDAGRGFSFQQPGPLDMRFDPSRGETAERWVNQAGREELARVLREYGEERFAGRVAQAIVVARPIRDTVTLAEVVRRAVPRRSPRLDPATRTFQALRIAVNAELEGLECFLERGLAALRRGGRMAVISFHSLEDRRVKAAFRGAVKARRVSLLTRQATRPPRAEYLRNPRCRSARLRGVERIR